jgi:hypothetical protein
MDSLGTSSLLVRPWWGSAKDILNRIMTQLRLVKNLFGPKSPHFSKNEQTWGGY